MATRVRAASRSRTSATRRWKQYRPAVSAMRANSARSAHFSAACTPVTSQGRTFSPTALPILERSNQERIDRTLHEAFRAMIDVYYWTTPNCHKLPLFLEETGLPYKVKPVNISRGEQFAPEFL